MAVSKKGFAVWLTGLPASGKSTLAALLARQLAELGVTVQVLGSDELRKILTPEPTYSPEERDQFYKVMAYIGYLLTENGVNVIFAATASKRCYRTRARQAIEKFAEVYVKCPLEVCLTRDTKGVYAKAIAGQATTVPGLQEPYEPPDKPEVVVETDRQTPQECVQQILSRLKEFSWITKGDCREMTTS